MVFNILQQGTRSCRKCGARLGLLEGSLLDPICDECKRKEREAQREKQKDPRSP